MGKKTKFQGSVAEAMQQYQKNSNQTPLWQHKTFLAALENSHNAIKSIAVLKRHLPKTFHPLVRFSQPHNVWILAVQKGITATQLNLLLDDLSLRITKDIGYAPRIKVIIHINNWHYAGFPLHYPPATPQETPSSEEADKIIADFLQREL